jgi:hypothetical protein
MSITNTQHQQLYRRRMKRDGWVLLQDWVPADRAEEIKEYLSRYTIHRIDRRFSIPQRGIAME